MKTIDGIKTVKGNLLTMAENGQFDVIFHGCNCFCKMEHGIADQIARKYPHVYEADKKTKIGDKNKLGTYQMVGVESPNHSNGKFFVINAYTQYNYGHGKDLFDYNAFRSVLFDYASLVKRSDLVLPGFPPCKVGFPMIGAGLAGGNWKEIKQIIDRFYFLVIDSMEVTIVEYDGT